MLPFDVTELLAKKLASTQRAPDGKLHPSGDLVGSLRHSQLKAAGAPQKPEDLVSLVRAQVGTATHDYFEKIFRGQPVMLEVKLDRWLPEGWSGTADWIAWDPDRRAFILGDLKTCKPGSIHYILQDGIKDGHQWQASVYWHALVKMGLPLVKGYCIYYLPVSQLLAREGPPVMPTLQEATPLPLDVVEKHMAARKKAVDVYLASIPDFTTRELANPNTIDRQRRYVTDALAPVQERDQKLFLNKALKVPAIDVKMTPNWSTAFCPFDDALCSCSQQKANKVGQWDRGADGKLTYVPSAKQEQPDTVEHPSPELVKRLVKAQADAVATP